MTEVLERLGYQVDFAAAQTCCGQPAFNSGYAEDARKVARHFLDVFNDAEYVVVPSGSCTSMITHHYEDIFQGAVKILETAHSMATPLSPFSTPLRHLPHTHTSRAPTHPIVTPHNH